MMRPSLPATLLLSVLLAACASNREASPIKRLEQSGPLKVNPGLLGQPMPAQSAPVAALAQPAAADTTDAAPTAEAPPRPEANAALSQRSIYFDFNSAALKAGDQQTLLAHARYLAANPQIRLRIEGNADERGSERFNLQLGTQRAAAVRAALVTEGAATQQITIKSLGKSQPKRRGSDEQSWAENRRADLIYENAR